MKFNRLFKIFLVSLILMVSNLITPLSWAADSAVNDTGLGICTTPPNLSAARAEARGLVSKIRAELAPVEDQIRNVPFLKQVEAGKAPLEQIAVVAAEQYSIIPSDWGSLAQLTARFDDTVSREVLCWYCIR